MNTDDFQKIAYEEIGGEEIFDPSPSIIYSKLTDQEEGGFVTSRF
jgi:DNA-binding PadR family transcriptional regulator